MRGAHFARHSAAALGLVALAALLSADPTFAQPAKPAEQAPPPRPVSPERPEAVLLRKEAYLLPPQEIVDAVLGARGLNVSLTDLSPDGRKFLVVKRDPLPPLDRLGCPCVHFAELAVDPVAYRARDLWVGSAEAFELVFPVEGRTVSVKAPSGARVASPAWSPDGSQLAFLALFPDATHICVADTETGACRKITRTPVLATLVRNLQWTLDGKRIQTVLRPEGQTAPKLGVATEPKVRVARDGKDPSRTIRYLLESPAQMQQLEHYITGQLALVGVADGAVTNVGAPAMVRGVSGAPGGRHFRVSTVKKPFSYYASFGQFGSTESVWDAGGKSLVTLSDRSLRDTAPPPPAPVAPAPTLPKGGVTKGVKGGTQPPANPDPKADPDPAPQPPVDPVNPPNPADPPLPVAPDPFDPEGKRDLTWRPDGKGLSFLQLEPAKKDAKDAKKDEVKKDDTKKDEPKVVRKDRVVLWLPPFGKTDEKVIYETETRILGVQYSADCRWLFLSQTVDNARQISALDLTDAAAKPTVVFRGPTFSPKKDDPPPKKDDDGSGAEQPGGFRGGATVGIGLMTRTFGSANVVRVSNAGDVYTTGTDRARGFGAKGAPDAKDAKEEAFGKPYIDSINIKTGKKNRVFEGKSDVLETIDAVDADFKRVYTTRQRSNVVPDSYMTDLATGKVTKLTSNVDKTPWFHELKTERFRVTRADGFKFWVKVTLPPKATGKLPALFWIYPSEFVDQAAYDKATVGRGLPPTGGRYTSPAPRSVAILTLAGYAVVEPDVPIVGPVGRMNDNYVADLRNSLWAAIDECDKRGLVDRDRLACGGHSYGAFSTANALAHTPFFKAGIAGDGCYNRTLTSMSFQSERRHLWDARETYLEMSPLLRANQINGALLMYHGMEDENAGTHPMNSEALFAALDGMGKNAALYMYPYEGHGPIARETNMDMWARWVAWLDLYVKNPKKK